MDGLCSGDLADITGGTLRLGTLPPIGGPWEPIRRVVTTNQAIRPGDVYWDLAESRSQQVANACEAFARGAVGVVTPEPATEPWAGSFVVHVPDSRRALRDVGCWARRRYRDRILALCCRPQSLLPGLVAHICHINTFRLEEGSTATGCSPANSGTSNKYNDDLLPSSMLQTPEELAIHLLHRPANQVFHVVSVNSEKKHEGNSISDLCSPHLAVINCSSCNDASEAARRIQPWLAALPTGGTAVLVHAPRELELDQYAAEAVRLVRIGVTDNCDWKIRVTNSEVSLARPASKQERVVLPVNPELPADDLAAAYVINHLLGLDHETFRTACHGLTNRHSAHECFGSNLAANATDKSRQEPRQESQHESHRRNLEFHR